MGTVENKMGVFSRFGVYLCIPSLVHIYHYCYYFSMGFIFGESGGTEGLVYLLIIYCIRLGRLTYRFDLFHATAAFLYE